MNELVKSYFRDFYVRWILGTSLILNLGLFLFFYIFIRQSNVPIVLHYNVDWGVDYFGEVKKIFTLPLIGILILIFNGILALRLWGRNKILAYFLVVSALLVEIFLIMAGIALYLINS